MLYKVKLTQVQWKGLGPTELEVRVSARSLDEAVYNARVRAERLYCDNILDFDYPFCVRNEASALTI